MMLAMAVPGYESESKHSLAIIDSVPSLIHTARPDGYLDYFNQRWLDYLGVSMEGLLGWKWTAAIHPEDVEANTLHELLRLTASADWRGLRRPTCEGM